MNLRYPDTGNAYCNMLSNLSLKVVSWSTMEVKMIRKSIYKLGSVFVFGLILLSLSGCDKKLFDYRNRYIGEYQFTYHYSYWQMGGGTGDTTISYVGKVKYGEKECIKFDWHNGDEYEYDVSRKGEISKCNHAIGKFDKNNFLFSYTDNLCSPGPLGYSFTVSLSGTKL